MADPGVFRDGPASRGSAGRARGSPRGCRPCCAGAPNPRRAAPGTSRGRARGRRTARAPASGTTGCSPRRSRHQALSCRSDIAEPRPPETLTTRGRPSEGPRSCWASSGTRSAGCRQSRTWRPVPPNPMYRKRPLLHPAVDPVREDALVRAPELARSREHPAAVDPHGEPEGGAVLEGDRLARELRRPVQRERGLRREALAHPLGAEALGRRLRRVRLEGPIDLADAQRRRAGGWSRRGSCSAGRSSPPRACSTPARSACRRGCAREAGGWTCARRPPRSTLGLAAASTTASTAGSASRSEGARRSACRTSTPSRRSARRFVSLPGRTRLSIPTTRETSPEAARPRASVLPTNPQAPVIRTLTRPPLVRQAATICRRISGRLDRDVPGRVVGPHLAQVASSSRCGRRCGSRARRCSAGPCRSAPPPSRRPRGCCRSCPCRRRGCRPRPTRGLSTNAWMKRATSRLWMLSRTCLPL